MTNSESGKRKFMPSGLAAGEIPADLAHGTRAAPAGVWISVDERLPETWGQYLLSTIYKTSVRSCVTAIWEDEWLVDDVDESETITHWTPLPEPPKGEG